MTADRTPENTIARTLREFREFRGLTPAGMAREMGQDELGVRRAEDGGRPSPGFLHDFQARYGVHLYVLAWAWHGDHDKLPERLRETAMALGEHWRGLAAGAVEGEG